MVGLVDLKVVLGQIPVVPEPRPAKGVGERPRSVEAGDVISKRPIPRFGQALVALTRMRRLMIPLAVLAKLAEDFFERRAAKRPLRLGRNLHRTLLFVLREVATLLEL